MYFEVLELIVVDTLISYHTTERAIMVSCRCNLCYMLSVCMDQCCSAYRLHGMSISMSMICGFKRCIQNSTCSLVNAWASLMLPSLITLKFYMPTRLQNYAWSLWYFCRVNILLEGAEALRAEICQYLILMPVVFFM